MVENVFYDWDSALAWVPDACIVANAASGHIEALEKLLNFGVPVLVEKPLASGLSGTERVVDLARRSGHPVLVGYCLRFHPAVKSVVRLLDSGVLGSTIQCTAVVGQHIADWRDRAAEESVSLSSQLGGGALLELSHEIDLSIALMGPVRETSGYTVTPNGCEVDMAASVSLLHESGVSSISLNMLQRPAQRSVTVVTTEGSVSADLITGEVTTALTDGQVTVEKNLSPVEMYLDQMRHFLDCIMGTAHPVSDLSSAIAVLECVEVLRGKAMVLEQ
jgi:predicted dehydrogenase